MFNDFLVVDGQGASPEKPIERKELYVVLFRDSNSRVFRPMFHANELKDAVAYINEHQASAIGEYRIKDREGKIA